MGFTSGEAFNVFSNLFILVPVIYGYANYLFPSATLALIIGTVSFFYHSCQTDLFCVIEDSILSEPRFAELQLADRYFVAIGLVYYSYFVLQVDWDLTLVALFISSPLILIGLLSFDTNGFITLYVTLGVIILIGIIFNIFFKRYFYFGIVSSIIAFILFAIGIVFYALAGDPGDKNYDTLHGFWHVFLMLGLLFIFATKINRTKTYTEKELDKTVVFEWNNLKTNVE